MSDTYKKYTVKEEILKLVDDECPDNTEHKITAKFLREISKSIIETFWPNKKKVINTIEGYFVSGTVQSINDVKTIVVNGQVDDEIKELIGKDVQIAYDSIKTVTVNSVDVDNTTGYIVLSSDYMSELSVGDYIYFFYFTSSNCNVEVNNSNGNTDITIPNDTELLNFDLKSYGNLKYNSDKTYTVPKNKITSIILNNDEEINGKEIGIINNNPYIINFLPITNVNYCFNAIYHVTSTLKNSSSDYNVLEPYFFKLMYWNKKWYADGQHVGGNKNV